MAKKHYDNKNEILRRLRENEIIQNRADRAVASSWTAYMMLGLLTLYEDLNFRETRLNKFISGVNKRLNQFDRNELSLDEMNKRLYDEAGIIVEGPK